MKILHTSDWHLGHLLYNDSQELAQRDMLDQLTKMVASEEPDAILISGDVYDTTQPSATVQQMFSDAIVGFHNAHPATTIICIAGNHDSSSKHMIFHTPWEALGVHMVGSITKEAELDDYIFEVKDKGFVVAVPFAADRFMPDGVFATLSERVAARNTNNLPVFLMAHLAVSGCDFRGHDQVDEEGKNIGGLNCMKVDVFGTDYDYVALGHIHKQQCLDDQKRVWYSGTPIAVSFDEVYHGNRHGALLVECSRHGEQPQVKLLGIESKQPLVNIPAEGSVCWEEAKKLLTAYPADIPSLLRLNVEVDKHQPAGANDEARAIIEVGKKACKLCFVNYQRKKVEPKDGTTEVSKTYTPTEIKNLSVVEAAKLYFDAKSGGFDKELQDLFEELNMALTEENN